MPELYESCHISINEQATNTHGHKIVANNIERSLTFYYSYMLQWHKSQVANIKVHLIGTE